MVLLSKITDEIYLNISIECDLYEWTSDELQIIGRLFEMSGDRYVHFFNRENCLILYNFITKEIKLYSIYDIENTDWT